MDSSNPKDPYGLPPTMPAPYTPVDGSYRPKPGRALTASAEARRRARIRDAAKTRKLADPTNRRTHSLVTLFRPAEAEAARQYAHAVGLTISEWLRRAALLVIRTQTNLTQADVIPSAPLTVADLEREQAPVRHAAAPHRPAAEVMDPRRLPFVHCGLAATPGDDGIAVCGRCGASALVLPVA